ncbi:MAG: aldehyde dehydrogenase [Bacteroidota bacterium]
MDFTHNIETRKRSLQKLLANVIKFEEEIIKALYDDFKKPDFETVATETSYIISDLKDTIKNIRAFSKPKRVSSSLLNFPSSDYIYYEPYGKVLIIAPWNYPFQLAICPLVAAVAAGNSVVLKPSELTPHTSAIIAKIIAQSFEKDHVSVEQGDAGKSKELLAKRWDYIFFTGSVAVGKEVAKAAAVNLTPVTLELGGKSPCIVDQTAKIELSARRIVWGKFVNAGQTCIAPDYILVHAGIKQKLIDALKHEIIKAYGNDIKSSPDFARIINLKNWERLIGYMTSQKVVFGGSSNKVNLFIEPTLMDQPDLKSDIMQNEIFGPLLPIISYQSEEELHHIIKSYEKPLSLYVFTEQAEFAEKIIAELSFGGGCVNDTLMHIANKKLPFGGVGHSGMGAYHGKTSFETFSHKKSISKKGTWLDIPLRYAPYKDKITTLRKLLKWI